jgi:hypothetical protein
LKVMLLISLRGYLKTSCNTMINASSGKSSMDLNFGLPSEFKKNM